MPSTSPQPPASGDVGLLAPGVAVALGVAFCVVGLWHLASERSGSWPFLIMGAVLLGLAGWGLERQRHRERLARKQAEQLASLRDRELAWMRRVAEALFSGDILEAVLQVVTDAAADLLLSESAAIGFVVEEGRFVRLVAGTGPIAVARHQLVPVDHSLLGWVVTHEEPLTSPDMAADPRNFPVPDLPLTSLVGVPLRAAGMVIGTLAVFNRRDGRPFTDADVRLLQALGDQVVVGLDRAQMLEESRRNETILASKNRELQRATELKSQFLANMSHELRTPLNAINGFSDLLLTGDLGQLNEAQREFLDSILRNGKHLLGLINSVLDLSKIEAGRMALTLTPCDLRDLIHGAVTDTAALRTPKQQQCIVEIGDAPLPILADGTRIRQILYNLLSNASKFTPDAGNVTISAVATRAPLAIPADRSGDTLRHLSREALWVSVRDSGVGIRPEDMSKLFQEFSQVDSSASRRQQGTGLGLALCRRFVEMHGGTIGCESVEGVGTTLWFLLPAEGPLRKAAPGEPGPSAAGLDVARG